MSREPTASEIAKAIGKKPVYKLAIVSQREGFLSVIAGSSLAGSAVESATTMRYKIGQITVARSGARGISVYEDKERAILVAPQFSYGRKIVVLKCLPVGDKSAGFTQNSVCVPAVIVGSVVHEYKPEPAWKDVTLECTYTPWKTSLSRGYGQFLVVKHGDKDVCLLGSDGMKGVNGTYKVEACSQGTVMEFRIWKKSS